MVKQEPFKLLDKVILGRASFKPPFKASNTLNDEATFVHVVNGKSRLYLPNNQIDFQSSDSFIMKCDNFVNSWQENEDGSSNEVIIVHFYPDVVQHIYDNKVPDLFQSRPDIKANSVEKITYNPLIESFISGLRHYIDHPNLLNEEILKIKMRELIMILVNSENPMRIRAMLRNLFKNNEYEFKEIIHSHLYEDLKIQDLAFFAGLSLSSFKRKFKSVFGTSPTQYIKSKRLAQAQVLLSTTNLRVSDIAYDVGFNDIGYFSKSFHAAFDLSPSDYRKMQVS